MNYKPLLRLVRTIKLTFLKKDGTGHTWTRTLINRSVDLWWNEADHDPNTSRVSLHYHTLGMGTGHKSYVLGARAVQNIALRYIIIDLTSYGVLQPDSNLATQSHIEPHRATSSHIKPHQARATSEPGGKGLVLRRIWEEPNPGQRGDWPQFR